MWSLLLESVVGECGSMKYGDNECEVILIEVGDFLVFRVYFRFSTLSFLCLDLTENGVVWFLCSSPLCEISASSDWLERIDSAFFSFLRIRFISVGFWC